MSADGSGSTTIEGFRPPLPWQSAAPTWNRWLAGWRTRESAHAPDPLPAMRALLAANRSRHCYASLVRVSVSSPRELRPADRMGPALSVFGPAGRLAPTEWAMLYIDAAVAAGEASHGAPGSERRRQWLDEVAGLLKQIGTQPGLTSMRVATAHRWSDRVSGLNELFAALG